MDSSVISVSVASDRTAVLRERWLSLHPDCDEETFGIIAAHYGESGRFYHTIGHIGSLLLLFDSVKATLREPLYIELALWFHDIVYDAQRSDNEEQSARLAAEILEPFTIPQQGKETITILIMATKHTSTPQGDDERAIIDIDLAILGSDKHTYDSYAGQVRAEYAHFSDTVYNEGRIRVLRSFLDREQIYSTEYFRQRYERAARENIAGEIKKLQNT